MLDTHKNNGSKQLIVEAKEPIIAEDPAMNLNNNGAHKREKSEQVKKASTVHLLGKFELTKDDDIQKSV